MPISQAVCEAIKTRETGGLFEVKYREFCPALKRVKPDLPKADCVDENMPYARDLFSRLGEVTAVPGRPIPVAQLADADALMVRSCR